MGIVSRWTSVIALAAAVAVLTPIAADAQALSYGVKGGLDLTRVRFGSSFAPDTGFSPGLLGGGFVGWRVFGRLSVRGEVLVVSERVAFESAITDTLQSLDVPVVAQYRLGRWMGRNLDVVGGYVVRHVLSATEKAGGDSSSIDDGIEQSNQAATVGGRIGLLPRWTADVRYVHGQRGVYQRIGGGTTGRTRTVQMTVEYAFK